MSSRGGQINIRFNMDVSFVEFINYKILFLITYMYYVKLLLFVRILLSILLLKFLTCVYVFISRSREVNVTTEQQISEKLYLANVSSSDFVVNMIQNKSIANSMTYLQHRNLAFCTNIAKIRITGRSLIFILERFFQRNISMITFSLTNQEISGEVERVHTPFHDNSIISQIQSLPITTKFEVRMVGVDIYRNNTELDSMVGIMHIQIPERDNQMLYSATEMSLSLADSWYGPKKMPNIRLHSSDQKEKAYACPILPGQLIKTTNMELPTVIDENTLQSITERVLSKLIEKCFIPLENITLSRDHFPHSMTFHLPKATPLFTPPRSSSLIMPGNRSNEETTSSNVFDYSNLYNRQNTFG